MERQEFIFRANFISSPFPYQKDLAHRRAAPVFRKIFYLDKEFFKAELYIATLGNGFVTINEKPLPAVLITSQSNYLKTIWYDRFDVTDFLKPGENCFLAELGNGFYNDFVKSPWNFDHALWRSDLKLIAELHIYNKDGTVQRLLSDESFEVAEGNVLFNSIRKGETQDAGHKICWDKDAKRAVLCNDIFAELIENPMPKLIEQEKLAPVSIYKNRCGNYLVDFGQNIAGYIWFRAKGIKDERITVRYAEIETDGQADQSNINCFSKGEFQTDHLILSGEEDEFSPRHVYHGFRYAEIIGYPGELCEKDIKAIAIWQDVKRSSDFSCESELMNKIYQCAIRSTTGNLQHTLTDCPTREKLGWLGDLQMSVEQLLTNFHSVPVLKKIMRDIIDVQNYKGQLPGIAPTSGWGYAWGNGPTFDGALFEIPKQIYYCCGDTECIDRYMDHFERYLQYLDTRLNEDGLLEIGLGDWSGPTERQIDIQTPTGATDTLYFMRFLNDMALFRTIRKESAKPYQKRFSELKKTFDKKYLDGKTGKCKIEHQTLLSFLITSGFYAPEQEKTFGQQLVRRVEVCAGHHECGIIGARHILHALTKIGRFDLAEQIMGQTDYPSWGKWVADGNTCLGETWKNDMSRNHHMFSDIASFYMKSVAGIDVHFEESGYNIKIYPHGIERLAWLQASREFRFGTISIRWETRGAEKILELSVSQAVAFETVLPREFALVGKRNENGQFISTYRRKA